MSGVLSAVTYFDGTTKIAAVATSEIRAPRFADQFWASDAHLVMFDDSTDVSDSKKVDDARNRYLKYIESVRDKS